MDVGVQDASAVCMVTSTRRLIRSYRDVRGVRRRDIAQSNVSKGESTFVSAAQNISGSIPSNHPIGGAAYYS
jgi:hypothetical protein